MWLVGFVLQICMHALGGVGWSRAFTRGEIYDYGVRNVIAPLGTMTKPKSLYYIHGHVHIFGP